MAETDNDYNPGPWKGWDYGSARKAYDPNAGRGYDDDASPMGFETPYSSGGEETIGYIGVLISEDRIDSWGSYKISDFNKYKVTDAQKAEAQAKIDALPEELRREIKFEPDYYIVWGSS